MLKTLREFVSEVVPTGEMGSVTTRADVRRIVAGTPIVWDEQEFTQDEVVNYLWQRCKARRAIYDKLAAGESRQHPGQAVYYYQDGDVYLEYPAQQPDAWDEGEIEDIIDQIEERLAE